MKGKKRPPPSPSILGYCARLALGLTVIAGLATLVVLPFQRGHGVNQVAASLFAASAAIIWFASLSVGLTIVIGGWACDFLRRSVYARPMGGLRDEWLDGPLPY